MDIFFFTFVCYRVYNVRGPEMKLLESLTKDSFEEVILAAVGLVHMYTYYRFLDLHICK